MISHEIRDGLFWRRIESEAVCAAAGTILYVHGLGESGLCFEGLMRRPELRRWNHLAPDLPGYGKSPWNSRPLRLGELAQRLRLCLANLAGTGPVFLVGHSMGGVVGQLVCEGAGGLVAGFVNVEGNISLEDCTFSGLAARSSLPAFLDQGFAQLQEFVYQKGLEDLPARGYHASLRLADPVQFHLNSGELVEASASENLAPRFAALRIPVKVFVAGLRGGLGARSLHLLREAGVDCIAFKHSGHWPFLDEEERFARLLRESVEGWRGPSPNVPL